MILLKIFDIKNMMTALLIKEDYDTFFLEDAKVNTFMKLQLSGFRNLRFYEDEERAGLTEYLLWEEVKSVLCSFISGNRTPDTFQISLMAPSEVKEQVFGEEAEMIPADFFLHFRYENEELAVVTGCSYHEFTMDKEAERTWDSAVKKFLYKQGISFEEQ